MPNKNTVLVIEDSRLIREQVKATLVKAGYEVLEADSGEVGLALAVSLRPDAVLLDVLLAGEMDGLTVCHEIRSMSGLEKTPVIIMSSLNQEADLAAGQLYGADAYLVKPIHAQTLLARIASVLKPGGGAAVAEKASASVSPAQGANVGDDIAEYRQALMACDQETLKLIGPSFLKTAEAELQEIIAAFADEDWATLERLAVTQKGVVGTFGAPYLEYLLSQIGQDAACQHVKATLIQNLVKEFPLFCAALAERLEAASPDAAP